MKQKFLFATVILGALSFASCKKDKKENPTPANPGSAKKLTRITKTESGVVTVYNLNYDANNRLSSYKSTNNAESIIFSYDNAGNLAGIEQKEDNQFKNIYTYTYVNNKPVSGTYKSWELTAGEPDALVEDDKLTYTVTNNQVSKIKLEMQDASQLELTLTYNNGNLKTVSSGGPFPYVADFTFGTKKPSFPKVTPWILDQAGFSLQFASNNEMLKAFWDFPGTSSDQTITTTYTYDSNGYVLTSSDGTAQLVYEYQ